MNSEQNQTNTLEQLTALLRQATQGATPPAPFGAPVPMFSPPTPAFGQPVQANAVLVPIRVETPAGEVGCYVSLPGSVVQNLPGIITQLQGQGWPIRIYSQGNGWQGRRSSWGRGRSW